MLLRHLLMTLLCAQLLKAEIFTSVQHLTNAFQVEKKIADALSNYLTKMDDKLRRIRRYLSDYEQVQEESKLLQQRAPSVHESDLKEAENLAGNPLQAFHLMKRLTIDWKHLQEHDPLAEWKEVEEAMNSGEVFGFSQFNDEEDLKGTAQAIILLQSIYQLNTTSLVHGNIAGIQTAAELTAQDCLYLGKHSFNLEMYYNAVLWFEQAYVLAGLENNQTVTQDQIIPFLNKGHEMFDENAEQNKTPTFISNKLSTTRNELNNVSARKFQLGNINMNGADIFRNYESLCRGEQLLPDSYVSKLTCYYDNRNSPYLVLMPTKTERLHLDPEILLFHDVITDNEIENIKLLANPELSRGMVRGEDGQPSVISKERISKIAWMDRAVENFIFKNIGVRVDELTGLHTASNGSSEQLQIGNYGTGGHYNPHVDYFKKKVLSETEEYEFSFGVGDRIATFMFYLSDVNRGGATAFPIIGVSMFPEKGSAAFWHNLKKSGVGDYRSLHGGCPVIHGSKWVANKWIRERNQIFKRPCSLSESE